MILIPLIYDSSIEDHRILKLLRYSNYIFLRVIGLTQKPQIMIDILKILLIYENSKILILRTNPSNIIQGIVIFCPRQ